MTYSRNYKTLWNNVKAKYYPSREEFQGILDVLLKYNRIPVEEYDILCAMLILREKDLLWDDCRVFHENMEVMGKIDMDGNIKDEEGNLICHVTSLV